MMRTAILIADFLTRYPRNCSRARVNVSCLTRWFTNSPPDESPATSPAAALEASDQSPFAPSDFACKRGERSAFLVFYCGCVAEALIVGALITPPPAQASIGDRV